MRKTRRICAAVLLLSLLWLSACAASSGGTVSTEEGRAVPGGEESAAASPAAQRIEPKGTVYYTYFDTVSYVYDYAGDSAERFDDRSAEVSHILSDYHKLFDIYHEYSGVVNLCTLNAAAGGEALEVDPRLVGFLLYAKELYERTDGEMNVMLGAVLRLWHDCREAASEKPSEASIPTEEALREAAKHTDIALLEIDPVNNTVRISDPLASIDVGALGKGYATECAAEALEQMGAAGYVLNIGGNIRCIGDRPDGSGWLTAIRDPDPEAEDYACRIRIRDTSCVTSGVYERYFTVAGKQYHHIIDKDTLYPAAYYSSLTVVTRDSGLADALSTALFCMPWEDGSRLAASMDGVEALWIFPDGEQRCTPGFAARIEETN
ncbi:MAG: FAD:protein FMN transferase [Oscillospiraceae bacterium]|nr:FAD:protein FMN transferase [Oscillospiraceae bacterium]